MPAPDLALDHGRLLLAGRLLIYLERTLAEDQPLKQDAPPRAYGLAPTALIGGQEAIAAIGPGEAIWLGLQAVDPHRPVSLRVQAEGDPVLDAHLTCPPDYYCLAERPRGSYRPFAEGRLTVATEAPAPAALIRIVDLDTFSELSGEDARPLDPDAGYKGWLLP